MAASTANIVASIESSSGSCSKSIPVIAPPPYPSLNQNRHPKDSSWSSQHHNSKYSGMDNSESNRTANTDPLLTPSTSSTKQSSITIVPAQQSPRSHPHSGAAARLNKTSSNPSSPNHNGSPRRRSTVVSIYRFVEQEESEPFSMVLFKWTLIIVGLGMLGVVLYFMAEVIWMWLSGDQAHVVDTEIAAQNSTISDE